MNFCGNCGTNIPEGSPFCPTCGAPAPAPENQPAGGKKMDIKKLIIAGVAVVVAVVLCIVLFTSCSSGPEKVVDKALSAVYEDFDAEALIDCMHEDIIDEMCEQADMDKDEIVEKMQDMLDEMKDAAEDDEITVEWEITEVDDMKKSELKDIQELYEDEFDLEVTDGKVVEVELTVYEDGDEEDDSDMELEVVKIDGEWYPATTNPSSLMAGM